MGMYVDGVWQVQEVNPKTKSGGFERKPVSFRDTISASGKYQPESGRYHLYVSYACPWAHRTLIYRKLKGLEQHIDFSVVHPFMGEEGWHFGDDWSGATGDKLYGSPKLGDIYIKSDQKFTGRVTVPVLWDQKTESIVNNESSEIIRIFNTQFNELTGNEDDYCPEHLIPEIDLWNEKIYESINNGVYKSGFARTQKAYEKAVKVLFERLEEVDQQLQGKKYLLGDQLTEADMRLFPTLVRFDLVYVGHFKCNLKRIEDFANLRSYLRRLLANPAFRDTTHFDHIKHHYYESHTSINPYSIVPIGPDLDYVPSE